MVLKNKKYLVLTGFLLISIACSTSIPFLGTTPAEAPTEVANLETMVAAAVVEKVAQTLEAMPKTNTPTPPPSETPLPTKTPLPTETLLPSPTATNLPPSPTPTSGDYPETGDNLVEGEDGKYAYFDYTGAYKIEIPEGWLPIRPGAEEYDAAWLLPEASSPEVRHALESMQSLDQNIFRIFILDTREGHYDEGIVSNINLLLDYQNHASLEEVFAQSVLNLPKSIPGLIVTSSNIIKTSSGIPYGIIISEWEKEDGTGNITHLYQQQALFSLNDKALSITFTSTQDFNNQILQDFEKLVDELRFLY